MKVAILTFGTRGDVQPFVALAKGLVASGHDVVFVADEEAIPSGYDYNFKMVPLQLNLKSYLNSEEGKEAIYNDEEKESSNKHFEPKVEQMLNDCWDAVQGVDGIIYDTMLFPVYHMANKLQVPSIMASVMPNMSPTRAFPLIGGPKFRFGSIFNRVSYLLYRIDWAFSYRRVENWCRKTLNSSVPSRFMHYGYRNGEPIPTLYSYSEHVFPSPKDWNSVTHATGYWTMNTKESKKGLGPNLEAFIDAGSKPIYVGFGSMTGSDPQKTTDVVLEAVQKSGERAVISSGWGGLVSQENNDKLFFIDSVDHSELLPRMKAVVHHGGAGTTGAGLRAGVSSVICPMISDQFFWGDIVHKRGVGPKPINHKELSADSLSEAIGVACSNDAMKKRSSEIGERIRKEDGVGKAVELVDVYFNRK